MPSISQSIITNVEGRYIETYLKKKGFRRSEEEQGQDLKYWVDNLLVRNKINVDDFEEFLFNELFWGKRKTIQVYKLDKIKQYKYPKDWMKSLDEIYHLDSMIFCNILGTIPTQDNPRRIAATRYEVNNKGELNKVQLLFVSYIQINGERGYKDSTAYIPVELDFTRKIMLIKAWTRQQVAHEENKAHNLMSHIKRVLEIEFGVSTKDYGIEHKKILFQMSKKFIDEAYEHVPTYNQIDGLQDTIQQFIQRTLQGLSLENIDYDANGQAMIPKEVMDFEGEIRNVIEGLTISDYFYARSFDEIWKMGLEAVVARVKFNDREKVLTSLRGEDTSTPIFCTKTFMSLKNRMEESERIETLWITKDRKKGNLNLKYDASNREYLEILVRYGIRFDEEDMYSALGVYQKYEQKLNQQIAEQCQVAICQ